MISINLFGVGFDLPLLVLLAAPAVALFVFLNTRFFPGKRHWALLALRSASIALLLLVLAAPYTTNEEQIVQETTSILVIDDGTGSMSVYGQSLGSNAAGLLRAQSGSVSKVELRNMTSQDYTALGDEVYQGILGSSMKNNVVIVATDGNSNRGADPLDVAIFAKSANSRVFAITPELAKDEAYVADIIGAKKTSINSEYGGEVEIRAVGAQASYRLEVAIDGVAIIDTQGGQNTQSKKFPFKQVFNTNGPHNITARITPQSRDTFTENNAFSKVVNVVDRPKVLLVTHSASSPLKQVLEEVYDVDVNDKMPGTIGNYAAIVLDDEPAGILKDAEALSSFLSEGSGLVVVGGNSSYSEGGYSGSQLESMLPVASGPAPEKKGDEINAIILIDISGSTGIEVGKNTKIDVEKAIAVKMIRDLSKTANIGVVAFNSDSFIIQQPMKLTDTSALEEKVSRLQFGGGTYIAMGLMRAKSILKSAGGAKYIILISDGVTNYPVQAFEQASSIVAEGIVLHSIGVGFDTDQSFMSGIAARGKGVYFAPSETDRVKIVLGGLEEGEKGKGFQMILTDTHHFITEGIEMGNMSVEDFNEVNSKSSSQVLAATQGMKPLLAVWHFGLGRVASLMVDDGRDWANLLYTEGSSKLISSIINWAIGDPERKADLRIECTDTAVGEEVPIVVTSKRDYPQVTAGGKPVELSRLDETHYYFNYRPLATGIAMVSSGGYSCAIASNYPGEYGRFEVNTELLATMAQITNGKVYLADNLNSLVQDVSEYTLAESAGVKTERINMQLWFTLIALALFSADVIIRRLMEIRQGHASSEHIHREAKKKV